ncbi:MAG: ABC transporter permease [Defluviitaleaceae bacterium]|nr:ABC transporter permease [Defluviitaleaceae bacterium]
MHKYILRRLLMMIPVVLGVLLIVFTIMYLTPGDPVRILLGDNARAEDIERLRGEFGLDDPFFVQFFNYVVGVVTRFDLGTSLATRRPVSVEILERFPTTFYLAVLSAVVAVILGVTFGIISATKQYSAFDNIVTGVGLFGVSMPSFWQGLMCIIIFSVHLNWLPATGSYGLRYFIMPVFVLSTTSAATIMRLTRSTMLEVIRQDYIRTARAKGQSERNVIIKHALRNSMIPVATLVGIQFGFLLGGSVLVEAIFAIPGLGNYTVAAIRGRDFPVVQGGVLFLAIVFSFVNLLVDILYSFLDPRIKSLYKGGR